VSALRTVPGTWPAFLSMTGRLIGRAGGALPPGEGIMLSIVLWILFGLIVGVIAKLLTPGREPGGFVVTTLLGIGGALLGGFLGRLMGVYPSYRSTGGFFMSILGAVIILAVYHAILSRRHAV